MESVMFHSWSQGRAERHTCHWATGTDRHAVKGSSAVFSFSAITVSGGWVSSLASVRFRTHMHEARFLETIA
ncbi:MAG: hypothetical protein WCH43_12445, partial [Verrucomicrobiota bacterium]